MFRLRRAYFMFHHNDDEDDNAVRMQYKNVCVDHDKPSDDYTPIGIKQNINSS